MDLENEKKTKQKGKNIVSFLSLVASLLLVAMPGAPSSFLFLVVRPGAPSSVLAPRFLCVFLFSTTTKKQVNSEMTALDFDP